MKRLIAPRGLWTLILLIAFFAIQLIPTFYQPIHRIIFIQEQAALQTLQEGHSSLESLTISEELFRTIQEEEHEITWNGKRYDIKSIKYHDGLVELVVKHDTLETHLKNIVSILQGQQTDDSSRVTHSGFFAFFYQAMESHDLIQPIFPTENVLIGTFHPLAASLSMLAPPPRA